MATKAVEHIHQSTREFVLACLLLLASLATANGELSMVLLIHRHGARTRLSKDSKSLAESQSTLTNDGMRQLSEVGRQARDRYMQRPQCSAGNTCLSGQWSNYSHSSWYVMSSATDRTLTSAQSFLVGALPPDLTSAGTGSTIRLGGGGGFQPVPIYSTPSDNDWLLRAYADEKCPNFLRNLQAFYSSAEFSAKVEETKELLTKVNGALKTSYSLNDMFNIFDEQNVQRSYGPGTPAGGAQVPLLDNATYAQVVDAANWLEWNRYGNRNQAKNLCGGGLLADILRHIDAGAGALVKVPTPVNVGPTFVEYSAHYPTMLCLLAAIGLNPATASPPDPNAFPHKIPAYGALIAIEVSISGQKLSVQFIFQNGPGTAYMPFSLPCSRSQDDTSCDYDGFKAMAASAALSTAGEWCVACRNVTMQACLAAQVPSLNESILQLKNRSHRKGVARWSLALSTLLAACIGAIVGVTLFLLMQRRRQLHLHQSNISV